MSDPTASPPPSPEPGSSPVFPEPVPLTFGDAAGAPAPAAAEAAPQPANPYGTWAGAFPAAPEGAPQSGPATVVGQYPPGQPTYAQPGYPQPGYAQPGYPQPGYQAYPYGYAYVQRRTNGMAIAALVVSIAGFFVSCFVYMAPGVIIGPIGAILGHVARKRLRANGEDGDGMALAGIIVGWILTGLGLLATIGIVIFFYYISQMPDYTSDPSTF
ncbi:hypothetical protein Cs7R123_35650 [Catellatospora sp. TT07R-123]|uniref:DUF4190 domain-containing protein n=1 Tax=Catellatospora sp. TT07R-123 TaxID=2733863 RepID=UPI001B0EBBE8|nr:DUF4190 domain-containing protein [Catellatospora sp. TT07R-123]GHJ46223.1 hypothetical protein Cs7R123_35650 [Catellatospora sp. TT07R-123]